MTSARGSGVWQSGDGAMVRLDGIFIRQHVASSPRQQPSPAHRRNRAVWPKLKGWEVVCGGYEGRL